MMKLMLSLTALSLLGSVPAAALSPPIRKGPVSEPRSKEALARLLSEHDGLVKSGLAYTSPERAALRARIDAAAAQKDAHAARLFWHTDLASAQAEAAAAKKPILSLRLLGRLDDDLSCANSRFFRTALYPDPAVNALLRRAFVLHWQSERPAPRVTIDFGDGRKVVRTITGNSIHYVLDAAGRPLDALPGLYGPGAFAALLRESLVAFEKVGGQEGAPRAAALRAFHEQRLATLVRAWDKLTSAAGARGAALPVIAGAPGSFATAPTSTRPSALRAAPIAMSKMATEAPILRRTMRPDAGAAAGAASDALFARLARVRSVRALAFLSRETRALVAEKSPRDWSDASSPKPLDRFGVQVLMLRFGNVLAEDTVKNTFTTLRQTGAWLAQGDALALEALNAKVYSELFLTPRGDPWLGLLPGGVFTGLDHDGVLEAK